MKELSKNYLSRQAESLARLGFPTEPYRGIESFRLVDRPIFRAREEAVRDLFRLMTIYRAVILSGSSGVGKSSLLNAGLIPRFIESGGWVERVRVQPHKQGEFVIERISINSDDSPPYLPSIFAEEGCKDSRIVLNSDSLLKRIREKSADFERIGPLVILCDQFEESVTLFEESPGSREEFKLARESQERVFGALEALICDENLPVKLLFAMREDYLSKVLEYFGRFYSQIRSQEFRLDQLTVDALPLIISGPYEASNKTGTAQFLRRLGEDASATLEKGLRMESENGSISLTETQIACRILWENPAEESRFLEIESESKNDSKDAVRYLFGRHMELAMKSLPEEFRLPAKITLARLVTSSQTRNIVSSEDLVNGLVLENVSPEKAEESITRLCKDARLVYRQSRGETPFYEIVSESLVPWILKEKAVIEEERSRSKRLEKLTEESKRQEDLRKAREDAAIEAEARLGRAKAARLIALSISAGVLAFAWFTFSSAERKVDAMQIKLLQQQEEVRGIERALHDFNREIDKSQTLLVRKEAELDQRNSELNQKTAEVETIRRSNRELNEKLKATERILQSMAEENGQLVVGVQEFQQQASRLPISQEESTKLNKIADSVIERAKTSSEEIRSVRSELDKAASAIDAFGWRSGRVASFGGPYDKGVHPQEGLALIDNWEEAAQAGLSLFLNVDRSNRPKARNLNPSKFYIAALWDYAVTTRSWLLEHKIRVRNPLTGEEVEAQPVDYGPGQQTGRLFEVSPGIMKALGLEADDVAEYLLEAPEQIMVARLNGHEGPINEAVFSTGPGNYVATASADKFVKVWTPEGGILRSIQGSSSRGGVRTVAFVPETGYLLSGSSGQSVRLLRWRGDNPGEVAQSPPSGSSVTRIAFNPVDPGMAMIAKVGGCQLLKLPDLDLNASTWLNSGAFLKRWDHTSGKAVNWAAFSSDGTSAVTSSDDYKVRVFETTSPYSLVPDEYVGNPADCKAPVRRAVFAPIEHERIIAGGAGTKVLLWKVGSNRKLRLLDQQTGGMGHDGGVLEVAFSPDGQRLASIATDGRCILWNVSEEKAILELDTELKGRLMGCAWSRENLAIVAEDGGLELWNMTSTSEPVLKFTEQAHDGVAAGVSFSGDGKLLLTWSGIPETDNIPSAKGDAASWSTESTLKKSDNTAALWNVEVIGITSP